ncbi:MAG: RNA polymerase sigma factor [Chloroflexota bacterium]|nr:RNA polymerase sigma factor [Chloroflexota bacterium]
MTDLRPLPRLGSDQSGDPDLADVVAAQGDRAAFDVLYRRYLDRVYGYAFYQLGDHHDAEDATERTFMAALRALPTFRDEGATFRAWLFRIAHNTIANAHRSRFRRRTEPLPEGLERAAPNADPASLVLEAEEARHVLRAIAELPDDRRQVVLLRFVDGLSSREIGQVMDRSEGAARVLLHRALRDLAARLSR